MGSAPVGRAALAGAARFGGGDGIGTAVDAPEGLEMPFVEALDAHGKPIDAGLPEGQEAARVDGATVWQTFWRVTLPNVKWGLLYGVLLSNARAMGEFGAVSVVSGHIRGLTNTMPLHVEILYNEYDFVGAFAVASLLALLALVTLAAKSFLEWRYGDRLSAGRSH